VELRGVVYNADEVDDFEGQDLELDLRTQGAKITLK